MQLARVETAISTVRKLEIDPSLSRQLRDEFSFIRHKLEGTKEMIRREIFQENQRPENG